MYPKGPYGLFLTCGQKKRINHLHNKLHLQHYELFFIDQWLETYTSLSGSSVVGTVANESILASMSKQTDLHLLYPHELRGFWELSSPMAWLGLDISCLACLDLAIDPKSQNSSTYKSHWYTSQVRTTYQHRKYIQQYIFPSLHIPLTGWKGPDGPKQLCRSHYLSNNK
jgi:hypothetical protein